jgi:hypothetical protein
MTRARFLTACLAATLGATATADAQQVRVTGASTMRYIELRPLMRDSVAADDVAGSGLLRMLPDGRTVRCVPDDVYCRFTTPGARTAAVPLLHDFEVNGWGFGRGIHAHAQFRARTNVAGRADLWPQGDDALDLTAAWLELDRLRYRLRAGRQWQVSGLGFYNFDGVTVEYAPLQPLRASTWLGRSLVRGVNEGRAGGALESIETLPPGADGVIAGAQLRYRTRLLAIGGTYQVDFRGDGAGLFAELASLNAALDTRAGAVDAAVELDVATTSLNEARLGLRTVPWHGVVLHAEARRYRPYFELWTIWGAFSPVGFDEMRSALSWSDRTRHLTLRGEAARRTYHDSDERHGLDTYDGNGWSVGAQAAWAPRPWRVHAAYRTEGGFGAARRDGHVGVRRELGQSVALDLQALGFQRLYEFRITEGTVYGAGAEVSIRAGARAQLFAGGAVYHHAGRVGAAGIDWNQRRASLRVQWSAGPDAGAVR